VVPTWFEEKPEEKGSTLEESGVEVGRNQEETTLQGFPPIATNPLGNTTISVAIGGTIALKR
jgi:hypothetical protein